MKTTKPIVIVGGGFGGLQAALGLERVYGHDLNTPIFLVDQSPYHVYTPSLYDLADAHAMRSVVIPFSEILAGTNIRFIQEKVTHIDPEVKQVITEHRQLPYHDLVLAAGSQTKPIRDEHANPDDVFAVKTVQDILRIRDHIEKSCQRAKAEPRDGCHSRFIIAGAGPTGVEFAGSLVALLKLEAKRHELPPKRMHIMLVDAADRILPRLDVKVSRLAHRYLRQMGVEIRLKTKLSWEDHERLKMNKDVIPTETLVWTIGVKPHSLLHAVKGFRHDDHGHVLVDSSLQVIDAPNVWVIGDAASVSDSGQAVSAIAHGRHVVRAIKATRNGAIAPAYQPSQQPTLIPLSKSYGLGRYHGWLLEGYLVILLKSLVQLRYLLSILPMPQAFAHWRGSTPSDPTYEVKAAR